jgi:hypothetical protein
VPVFHQPGNQAAPDHAGRSGDEHPHAGTRGGGWPRRGSGLATPVRVGAALGGSGRPAPAGMMPGGTRAPGRGRRPNATALRGRCPGPGVEGARAGLWGMSRMVWVNRYAGKVQ